MILLNYYVYFLYRIACIYYAQTIAHDESKIIHLTEIRCRTVRSPAYIYNKVYIILYNQDISIIS